MAFMFVEPSPIVPILLGVLIAGVVLGIMALFRNKMKERKKRMNRNIQSLKMFNAFSPDLKVRKQKK